MAEWSAGMRHKGATVGFVPTMGALHEGHIDLVRRALDQCGAVACSIFVNPLQFNDIRDLEAYPRQFEKDRELLLQAGCHALFVPTKEELFAGFEPASYDLGGIDSHWEGPSRPGHFQGVVNVVERLFHYVRPDRAFFGEKDRQQLTILRHVARELGWPERIVPCPTVRDRQGLALSSRNARLSPAGREQALVLHRALLAVARSAFHAPLEEARAAGLAVLAQEPGVELDHLGVAHPDTLHPIEDWGGLEQAVALVAAWVEGVRLIDNITLSR